MERGEERPTRRAVTSAVVTLLLAVTGCGILRSPQPTHSDKQQNPTAKELSERTGMTVSEYPGELEKINGADRFCREIGGVVLRFSPDGESVVCELNGKVVDIPKGDAEPKNDQPMDDACAAVEGDVVFVAVDYNNPYSVPACATHNQKRR